VDVCSRPQWGFLLPAACFFAVLFSGCASTGEKAESAMDPVKSYEQAMETFPGADLPPGSAREKEALARFSRFFGNLNEANARELTRETYAKEFFFYDTLKEIRTLPELEEYFLETAHNTVAVSARIDDVARSGNDFYVRWTMEIQLKKFQRGRTLTSVGMTHLRFNDEGKIILHHDYWDAASGFYQYVPVLGGVIRYIRSLF
jgi:hypothetical protein